MSRLDVVRDEVLNHPLHQACELELLETGGGMARLRFPVNSFTINPQGALHGGILYAIFDVACFFALVPLLDDDEHPVSIEVHTSVLRAARAGEIIEIEARVDRRGRTLGAMRADAFAISSDGERRLIGTGNVTKSILKGRGS